MEHRIYLYASAALDGGSSDAHLSRKADRDALYAQRSIAVSDYDNTYRGFTLVNYNDRDSTSGQIIAADPWAGTDESGLVSDDYNLDYTGLTPQPFPEYRKYFGYTSRST